jgi:phenylpyruvate tautomerase PptA (4-oxalocrotonate tautomerase family)
MPFVRIDTLKGRYNETQRKAMGEAVYQALRDVGVPEGDRFQALAETELVFDPHYLGIERTDGFVAVQITWNTGRSVEQKKQLYAGIATRMSATAGVLPADILINLIEVPRENWSFGNGEAQYAPK